MSKIVLLPYGTGSCPKCNGTVFASKFREYGWFTKIECRLKHCDACNYDFFTRTYDQQLFIDNLPDYVSVSVACKFCGARNSGGEFGAKPIGEKASNKFDYACVEMSCSWCKGIWHVRTFAETTARAQEQARREAQELLVTLPAAPAPSQPDVETRIRKRRRAAPEPEPRHPLPVDLPEEVKDEPE